MRRLIALSRLSAGSPLKKRPQPKLAAPPTRRALLALVASAAVACKRKKKSPLETLEQSANLVSVVQVTDPVASAQLIRGFYPLEANAWRWTMREFSVALKPPPGAAQKGAKLNLQFSYPEVVFNKLGTLTLNATIDGLKLPPETYSKPGNYTYTRDVPASALSGNAAAVDFVCDKVFPPTGDDRRELALVATSISLE
jgi:hypothetical protein